MLTVFACCVAGATLTGCLAGADDLMSQTDDLKSKKTDWRVPLSHGPFALDAAVLDTASVPFQGQGSYLSLEVPYAPVSSLRTEIEQAAGANAHLKNRGEAHITVVTPPEAQALKSKLSMNEIEKIARAMDLQSADLTLECIGVGSKGTLQTVYVVVQSQRLLEVRRAVRDRFVSLGGKATAFNADAYLPHITLGFTDRDLFESDGVVKDVASCPNQGNLAVQ
jgi:2'-5' RNA ligase